jgi:endo-1,4-beta-D-glucanase Y
MSKRTIALVITFVTSTGCGGAAGESPVGEERPRRGGAEEAPLRPTAEEQSDEVQSSPHGGSPIERTPRPAPHPVVRPSGDRAALVAETVKFYAQWKARYLVEDCGPGQFYVGLAGEPVAGGNTPDTITFSEAHGFGMLIVASIGGLDPDGRRIFDGLHRFFRDHPTDRSPDLMSFSQVSGCRVSPRGRSSATDGDLDIAHALLVANARFGRDGEVDYLAEARKVIAAIKTYEFDRETHLPLLGSWAQAGVGKLGTTTRSSDLHLDHFRAFAAATNDRFWSDTVDRQWSLIDHLQTAYAPETGLLSDFVIETRTAPKPPHGKVLEGPKDGMFAWNACRVPLRLGTDCVVSGDPRARRAVGRMNTWIRAETGGDPRKIDNGYQLDGRRITDRLGNEAAFVAPFGVAAMCGDEGNQAWVDAIWAHLVGLPIEKENYYGNTIKMLAMIVMSDLWVDPGS